MEYSSILPFFIINKKINKNLNIYVSSSVCKPKHLNNTEIYEDENDLKKNSKRQATSQNVPLKKKTRCSLALVADHRFYTEIGNSNIKQTTAYLVNINSFF